MTKNFVEELRWRGMLAQIMPGTEEYLNATWCLRIWAPTLQPTLSTSVTSVVS